jgi:methionyl-tRNA formyltransferase
MNDLRIAFAGDRDIAVKVLQYLLNQQVRPSALLVVEAGKASHAHELISQCSFLDSEHILQGRQFRTPQGIERLRQLDLDYILCIHFPYIVPEAVLSVPHIGVLNLHPAYLPYNRGWHTPSWAILENTPIGATLHFMDAGVDTGDIVHQKSLEILASDTAHTLYQRVQALELETFQEAWMQLVSGTYQRHSQSLNPGTMHRRQDLFDKKIQRIELDETTTAGDLLRRLRALTTNDVREAAYYEVGNKCYRVQIYIHEEVERTDND